MNNIHTCKHMFVVFRAQIINFYTILFLELMMEILNKRKFIKWTSLISYGNFWMDEKLMNLQHNIEVCVSTYLPKP